MNNTFNLFKQITCFGCNKEIICTHQHYYAGLAQCKCSCDFPTKIEHLTQNHNHPQEITIYLKEFPNLKCTVNSNFMFICSNEKLRPSYIITTAPMNLFSLNIKTLKSFLNALIL